MTLTEHARRELGKTYWHLDDREAAESLETTPLRQSRPSGRGDG